MLVLVCTMISCFTGGAVITRLCEHAHTMEMLTTASEAQDRALALDSEHAELETAMRSLIHSQEQIITSKSASIDLLKQYAHEKDVEVGKLRDLLGNKWEDVK